MTVRRIVFLLAATLLLIGATYAVNRLVVDPSGPGQVSMGLDSASFSQDKTTDELIAFWRDRFDNNPHDFISLTYLGQSFLRQARETGNVSDYERAEAALRKALEIDPKYELAMGYLSAALYAKHDFQGALDLAQRIFVMDPHALLVLGTIGDAKLELGDYAGAETAYRELLDRDPSPPVYARVARLDWLQGRTPEAIALMQKAATGAPADGYAGEEAAWYEFQLGELYFNSGEIEQAGTHYTAALGYFDRYYLALAGLGKVYAAQGQYEQSIAYYQRAIRIIPQPAFLAALGDVYTVTGQADQAQDQFKTVEFIGKLAAINQIVYNRELVLYDANHDHKLEEALNLAQTELAVRKDIYGYDAFAWALYKNGRYEQAANAMDQAMKLGTHDALLYYHAGMIYAGVGNRSRAQSMLSLALSINPHFDLLQAQIARTTLDRLKPN